MFIAQIASKKARELGAPIYTQLDVNPGKDIEIIRTEEEAGCPLPTLRIARGAVQWAKERGFTELWIVAAKPHLWRCERDLAQAVKEAKTQIGVYVCPEINEINERKWFCHSSFLFHTRSREKWLRRETILRAMPFFIYKRVAK
jgi:hypothetical protein